MEINNLVSEITSLLMTNGITIGTAEECTSGLIGACLASDDYAQRWYKGSIVAFSCETIEKLLEVPNYIIARNNMVSSQVASQMSLNALYKLNVDMTLSIIGYVDGVGSSDVEKGTVQMAIAKMKKNSVRLSYKKIIVNEGTRGKNLELCIKKALEFILSSLKEE